MHLTAGCGYRQAILLHAIEMESNPSTDFSLDCCDRFPCCHATGKIRYKGEKLLAAFSITRAHFMINLLGVCGKTA